MGNQPCGKAFNIHLLQRSGGWSVVQENVDENYQPTDDRLRGMHAVVFNGDHPNNDFVHRTMPVGCPESGSQHPAHLFLCSVEDEAQWTVWLWLPVRTDPSAISIQPTVVQNDEEPRHPPPPGWDERDWYDQLLPLWKAYTERMTETFTKAFPNRQPMTPERLWSFWRLSDNKNNSPQDLLQVLKAIQPPLVPSLAPLLYPPPPNPDPKSVRHDDWEEYLHLWKLLIKSDPATSVACFEIPVYSVHHRFNIQHLVSLRMMANEKQENER